MGTATSLVLAIPFIFCVISLSFADHQQYDQVIGQIPIPDVSKEINGIDREVEGNVFPESKPRKATILPRLYLKNALPDLISSKLRRPSITPSMVGEHAEVTIIGDQQYFPNIRGHITLTQIKNGPVIMTGSVRGLPRSGFIGMHFHEHPTPYEGTCQTVGDHYNPYGMKHGDKDDLVRHLGDEGNIVVQGAPGHGIAHIVKSDFRISLHPHAVNSVIGRPLVIHLNTDDLGRGFNYESKESGNSGTKIACGNVKIV